MANDASEKDLPGLCKAEEARRRAGYLSGWVATRLGLACLLIGSFVGCSSGPDLVYLPDQAQPKPIASVPVELRLDNWIGRNDRGMRGGSCVHASTRNVFRTIGRQDLDQLWRANKGRGYEGPETESGILRKLTAQGIPFATTTDADSRLFEASTKTHRPGMIFYYPNHCVTFVEYAVIGGRECAILLDNARAIPRRRRYARGRASIDPLLRL